MSNRNAELDGLMRQHKFTARQVGAMIAREPKTVRNWRSKGGREIPEHALELLKLRIAAGQGRA